MAPETFRTLTVDGFLDALAAKTAAPGGGAAAGMVGATACALASMVVEFSIGKKNLAEHQPALVDAQGRLARARRLMLDLADEDAAAYGAVNELSRLPEGDPRRAALPAAQRASVQVPMTMLAACTDVLRLMETLAPIANRFLRSDLAAAAVMAAGAARSALWNVRVNVQSLSAGEGMQALAEGERLAGDCAARAARVEAGCV